MTHLYSKLLFSVTLCLYFLTFSNCNNNSNKSSLTANNPSNLSIDSLLHQQLTDSERTEILIVGTPHFNELTDSFQTSFVDSLIVKLKNFKPDLIGIESMPPEMIHEMSGIDGNEKIIVQAFAEKSIFYSNLFVNKSASSFFEMDSLLNNSNKNDNVRLKIVKELLTQYDYYSALLQWTYLPKELRTQTNIFNDGISAKLNADLSTVNEIHQLAIPLARMLNIQKLYSIDDHYDDLNLLPVSEKLSSEITKHPLYKEIANSKLYTDLNEKTHNATVNKNLFPLYLYMNSPEYQSADVKAQWGFFLKTKMTSGLDRYRYSLWQVRNFNIVSNILKAVASSHGKRMVVIIGAAHKPFLESYLTTCPDIKLLSFSDELN